MERNQNPHFMKLKLKNIKYEIQLKHVKYACLFEPLRTKWVKMENWKRDESWFLKYSHYLSKIL